MKAQQKPETMLDILEATVSGQKTYEQIVEDGGAVERLLATPEFQRYQRIVSEGYLALVERIRIAPGEQLPQLQGALIQHNNLMRLPGKIVENATRVVGNRRSEVEMTTEER